MGAFSDKMENDIINHFLRNATVTPATQVWVALFTASTNLESNAPSAEVSGGAYARQQVTFGAASGGASDNAATITFPTATASWGTVSHAALVDHSTNVTWGTNVNVLMWNTLSASKTIDTGDTLVFNTGDLDVSCD